MDLDILLTTSVATIDISLLNIRLLLAKNLPTLSDVLFLKMFFE
ncbi:hypothetical protein RZN22_03620 [Bacillaceae bacterium S4-13-58]